MESSAVDSDLSLSKHLLEELNFKISLKVEDTFQKGLGKIHDRMDRLELILSSMQFDQVEALQRRVTSLEAQMQSAYKASLESGHPSSARGMTYQMPENGQPYGYAPVALSSMETVSPVPFSSMESVSQSSSPQVILHRDVSVPSHIEPHLRPESMYNYCMHRLTLCENPPWLEPGVYLWLTLLMVQFFTITAFVVCNDMANNAIGATPPSERKVSLEHCLFQSTALWGVPLVQYCIGYSSILLVASVIRSDDKDSLMAAYPSAEDFTNSVTLWIAKSAWFWQIVFLPGCFALEAATMFASSRDAYSVVMNTLSVTFIMDIDNMLYRNILSDVKKAEYQHHKHVLEYPMPLARGCSWRMFIFNIVTMTIMYTRIVAVLGSHDFYGDGYIADYWSWLTPMYLAQFVFRRLTHSFWSINNATESWHRVLAHSLPKALWSAILSMLIYRGCFIFVTGRFNKVGTGFAAVEFNACFKKGFSEDVAAGDDAAGY